MRRLYILLASGVIAATLIAVASSTGASAAGEKFAAIAFTPSLADASPGEGFYLQQAKRAAIAECQHAGSVFPEHYRDDCQGAVWVRNGWAAVAMEATLEGPPFYPQWGWGWGDTQDTAETNALKYCRQDAHEECTINLWAKSPSFDPAAETTGGGW
jgi:hypothetical protein